MSRLETPKEPMGRKQYPRTLEAVRHRHQTAWELVDAIAAECDLEGDGFARGELLDLHRYLTDAGVEYSTESLRKHARVARWLTEATPAQVTKFRQSSPSALVELAQAGFPPDVVERVVDEDGGRLSQANARHAARSLRSGVDTAINRRDPSNWDQERWAQFEKDVLRGLEVLMQAKQFEREGIFQPSGYLKLMLLLAGRSFAEWDGAEPDWDAELARLTDGGTP